MQRLLLPSLALAGLSSCVGFPNGNPFDREIQDLDAPTTAAQDPEADQTPVFAPQAPFGARLSQDWIRLVSDEWLMGTFESLRSDTVEFDSDKLGLVEFDWGDVAEVRCKDPMIVLLDDGTVLRGTVRLIGQSMMIGSPEPRRLTRSRVLAIVPEGEGRAAWRGKFSVSYTTRAGNTQQTDLSTYGFLRAETAAIRWDTTYNGYFSESNNDQTANSHRGTTRIDVYVSPKLYIVPLGVEAYRDPFQNLYLRTTTYAGAGYDIYDQGDDELSVFAGPAWLYRRLNSVAPGEDDEESDAAGIAVARWTWEVNDDVDVDFSYQIVSPFDEPADWNHNLTAGLSVDLVEDFDIDIRFVWDRVNRPTDDQSGMTPEQDDFRTVVGIGYSF